MGLVGRRLNAAIAAAGVAVLSAGVLTAELTAPPTYAGAAAASLPGSVVTHRLALAASSTSTIDKTLTAAVRDRLSRSTAAGYSVVVDVAGVGRVVSVHPGYRIRPASTQKLFTTLPLLLADPERHLVTEIRTHGRVVDGVLHGNLIVKSSGDPSLMPRHLVSLSRQVRDSGVRRVTGELRVDIGDLSLATRHHGWQPGSVPYDVGPLSPFPLREDIVSRSSSYLRNPTMGNLKRLRAHLVGAGVSIHGGNRIVRDSSAPRVLATHQSGAMSKLIQHTLQESDNFFAESFLNIEKRWRVNRLLRDVGLNESYATDGSGLSYSDYETARGEVKLLHYAARSAAADGLVGSLPVGCQSGTLSDRFCNTIGEGMVWAKTGTLRYNRALAGYTYDHLGRRVTFSILTYGVRNLTSDMHAIDRAVLVLRRYAG
jgi:serine-type D-Ala-D-Ala carboxypeptidase/endopeptidase (penicillin-binding protein 4)